MKRPFCLVPALPLGVLPRNPNFSAVVILGLFCAFGGAQTIAIEADFEVNSFIVNQEGRPTTVIEWPLNVQLIDGYFTASAEGTCRIPIGEKWRVGFIQIITEFRDKRSYSDAWTEYQFPQVPISDHLPSKAPFYDCSEIITGTGQTQNFSVTMNDNLTASITWMQPAPPNGDLVGASDLRYIEREQKFMTWLAARNCSNNKVHLLRKTVWEASYRAEVDPAAPLGTRVHFLPQNVKAPLSGAPDWDDLNFLEQNKILETDKCANDSQVHFWFSKKEPLKGIPLRNHARP